MFSLLFGLIGLALRIASLAMLAYCVMSFIMPQSDLFRKAASYVEPVLTPVRMQLYKWFPSLRSLPVDFSPLAIWLAVGLLERILGLLRRVF